MIRIFKKIGRLFIDAFNLLCLCVGLIFIVAPMLFVAFIVQKMAGGDL